MAQSLPIPAPAQRDPKAVNLASIWIAEQGLHCNLTVGVYENHPSIDEETAWGRILADTVRQVASALAEHTGSQEPHENLVNRIWTAFHEELSKPSGAS